jgi:hypothetical protein
MRPQVLGGIQERADAFIKKCTEVGGESMDVYVRRPCIKRVPD